MLLDVTQGEWLRDRYVNVALGVREKRDEGAEDTALNHRTGLRPGIKED
ncbi:hypothetical protein [Burkholderia ubonensis]|nr:hypothetical protein [Burkholderia ubonensis]